ncbi:MAG TPA: asparaginase [Pseudonocardia sp.]
MTASVVMAEVVRNGFVEGRHHGSVAVTAPDGTVEWSLGVVGEPMFPRSSNKPLQLLGLLRAGVDLHGELLALAGGSHSGEAFHLDGVRRILAGAGLDEAALRNPRAYPLDRRAQKAWVRARQRRDRVAMNCSGKHAAMLATCVRNGWSTDDYRDPGHPVQLAVRAAVEDCARERVAAVAVDGCGTPLLAISLAGVARAFGLFAAAPPGTDMGRIADAVRAFPRYASGTRRTSVALINAVPGLFCKSGAEGVFAVGLPDGRGVAVKIDDGSSRARGVVVAATLCRLGYGNPVLRARSSYPVLGGGEPVGAVRPGPALRAD